MKKTLITLAILAAACSAHADSPSFWDWSYTGTGVSASGTLSVLGDASTPEAVTSFSGQRNGNTITGLVPLGADSARFIYDNMFTSSTPVVNLAGILFNVTGLAEHTNLYFDQNSYHEVSYFGTGSWTDRVVDFNVTQHVSAVPEPESLALLLAGLGVIGYHVKKKKPTAEAEQAFA
jgi:hypothetical protein